MAKWARRFSIAAAAALIGLAGVLAGGSMADAAPLKQGKGELLVRTFVELLGDAGPDVERALSQFAKLGFKRDKDGTLVGYGGGALVTVEPTWMIMTLELEAWGDEVVVMRDAVTARFSESVEFSQTERNLVGFEITTDQTQLVVDVIFAEKQGGKLFAVSAMAFSR